MKNKVIRVRERHYNKLYKGRSLMQIFAKAFIVFCGILIIGSLIYLMTHKKNKIVEEEVSDFQMPQVTFFYGSDRINAMEGQYTKPAKNNAGSYVLPVQSGQIYFAIKSKEKINSVSYEITSLDGKQTFTEAKVDVGNASKSSGKDVEEKEELCVLTPNVTYDEDYARLVLDVKCDGEHIYYPIKISTIDDKHLIDMYKLGKGFSESTLDSKRLADYENYLESSRSESEDSYGHVTLKSSIDYFAWTGLDVEKITDTSYYFTEILNGRCTMQAKYRVNVTVKGETQRYFVSENMTNKYSDERDKLYVINYDRTLDREFQGNESIVSGRKLDLGFGIFDESKGKYDVKDDGTIVSFVKGGSLWQYNSDKGTLRRIFPIQNEGKSRDMIVNNRQVKIINSTKEGALTFMVVGNCLYGDNAGKMGASIYYYEGSGSDRVFEDCFIESGLDMNSISTYLDSFVSNYHKQGITYYYKNKKFVRDKGGNIKNIAKVNSKKNFVYSVDGNYVAYTNNDGSITLWNLKEDDDITIDAKKDERLQVIGFTDSNLVYGVQNKKDKASYKKKVITPYRAIYIVDSDGDKKKEYEAQDEVFVSATMVEDNVKLVCAYKKGNSYKKSDTKYLTTKSEIKDSGVTPGYYLSDEYGVCNILTFKKKLDKNTEFTNTNYVTEIE